MSTTYKVFLSFRVKLLLAMMMVVGGVTGATLFVTQERVQAAYERLFLERFQSQIKFFAKRQYGRLAAFKERSRALAASTLMVVALRNTTNDAQVAALYRNTLDELLAPDTQGESRHPSNGENAVSPADPRFFFRFLDRDGRVMQTADSRAGMLHSDGRRRMELQLVFVGKALDKLEQQTIGYLAPERELGRSELTEVIVTPIRDPARRTLLGAMVMGFPLADLGERDLRDLSQINSGIWLENKLYSQTIPAALRIELAAQLSSLAEDSNAPELEFIHSGQGETHWVFCRALNQNSAFPRAYQVCLYSLAGAEHEKQDLRWRIAGFAALAFLGAFALSMLISHGLSVPLWELVAGNNEIRRGNLGVKVSVRSRDEFGTLASSFNEMVEGLAMKEKYRDVLNKVADKAVAQELMAGVVQLGGEEREVSVLFCDIRGFTALTENMPPPEVIRLLNEHFTPLTKVVYEHHGTVDKFVGDMIMALFGAPKSYGNDVENAVRCALRMIQERYKLNQTSAHQIQVGIGIATGRVVAGCMGSEDRLNYTVLGQRVNLAARLCSKAAPMEVVIDQATRDHLKDLVAVNPTDPLQLKGFDGPVRAFQLLEVRPATGPKPVVPGGGQAG